MAADGMSRVPIRVSSLRAGPERPAEGAPHGWCAPRLVRPTAGAPHGLQACF
jgi:hypothetical protein